MEIGPFRTAGDGRLEINPGSWIQSANLLFVDNPVGTGFGHVEDGGYARNLPEMADQFVNFLEKWFAIFPEHQGNKLYLAGESYAGQYIPYIAKGMVDRNLGAKRGHAWDLAGILLGSAWVSPKHQYRAQITYAYDRGIVARDSTSSARLERLWDHCWRSLRAVDAIQSPDCEAILEEVVQQSVDVDVTGEMECVNIYDVRLRDAFPSCGGHWPPTLARTTHYLRRPDVARALHVDQDVTPTWTECSESVRSAFEGRGDAPSSHLLPLLLQSTPVLLFNGGQDLVCNHVGTKAMISDLELEGGRGFESPPGDLATPNGWWVNSKHVGL